MSIKVGDRVKFLTESGGGIVRKIMSPTLVSVETEDGFEIPTSMRDLVVIEPKSATERLFVKALEKEDSTAKVVEEAPAVVASDSKFSPLIVYPNDRNPQKYAVSIAFVPLMQQMLLAGELNVYLVNYSNIDLNFSLFRKIESHFYHNASEVIPAFQKYFVAKITREELDSWLNVYLQMSLVPSSSKQLFAPVSAEMQLKGSRFYSENSYALNSLIHQKALIYNLVNMVEVPVIQQIKVKEDLSTGFNTKGNVEKNDSILKHKTEKDKAVVDMHIWELTEDHNRLTPTEMLDIQLRYFVNCLQSAIDHRFKSVVFIHGVGTGRLKEEIKALLDEKENLRYRPASMAEFGVGATLVELP